MTERNIHVTMRVTEFQPSLQSMSTPSQVYSELIYKSGLDPAQKKLDLWNPASSRSCNNCVIAAESHRERLKLYFNGLHVIQMRVHFWPLLIGALVLIWGIITLAGQILGIEFDISWWAIVAIIIGVWILSHAIRKPEA